MGKKKKKLKRRRRRRRRVGLRNIPVAQVSKQALKTWKYWFWEAIIP